MSSSEANKVWNKRNPEYHKKWRESHRSLCATYTKNWKLRNPDKCKYSAQRSFRAGIKYRYGLDIDTYNRILQDQSGRCSICSDPLPCDFHVDHDHINGRVRGLLCGSCNNRILPIVEHCYGLIMKSLEYLKLTGGRP